MDALLLVLVNAPTLPPIVVGVWKAKLLSRIFHPALGMQEGQRHRIQRLWKQLMRNAHLSPGKPRVFGPVFWFCSADAFFQP